MILLSSSARPWYLSFFPFAALIDKDLIAIPTNNLTRIAIYNKVMNMDDNLFKYTDFQGVIVGTDDSESRVSLGEVNPDIYKIIHPQIWATIYIQSTLRVWFQLPDYPDFVNRQHSVRKILWFQLDNSERKW